MYIIKRDWLVGFGVCLFSISLIVYLIPQFVDSPRSVRSIVLSPVFWPSVIAWMMLLVGVGILVSQYFERGSAVLKSDYDEPKESYSRVFVFAAFLAGYYLLLPVLGMIWTSSLAYIIFSIFISGTEYRKTAVIVGVLLPMALYVFFYHVAGVNIPQNEFVRLP
jgi:hypothetical protein